MLQSELPRNNSISDKQRKLMDQSRPSDYNAYFHPPLWRIRPSAMRKWRPPYKRLPLHCDAEALWSAIVQMQLLGVLLQPPWLPHQIGSKLTSKSSWTPMEVQQVRLSIFPGVSFSKDERPALGAMPPRTEGKLVSTNPRRGRNTTATIRSCQSWQSPNCQNPSSSID